MNLQIWENDPVERLHSQFFKYYLGLNKRAPNVAARNEVGRFSLKSRIYRNVLQFWLHLKALPDDHTAKQCLYISKNLALSNDQSYMNSISTLLMKYNHTTSASFSITNKNPNSLKQYVSTLFSNIEKDPKAHQMKLIKMNTKLIFYSKFINNINGSDCYDLAKNMRHRRTLAKFRVGNHNLQIEKGRHTKPLTPRELRSCECYHSKNVEDECHFFFDCVSCADLRNNLFCDIREYCESFKNLLDEDLIAFFFNSVDAVICKKKEPFYI